MSTLTQLQPYQHRRAAYIESPQSRSLSVIESKGLPTMNIARASKTFHVVIIGGAFAGIRAAKDLEELVPSRMVTITVIEKRDRYFYNLGALRSVAKSELIDLVWLPYDNIFRYPHNTVIQGEVASVHPNSVILKNGHKVNFDSLLVATGSIYPTPCKVEGTSHLEGKAEQRRYFDMVRVADSVLIIGGGPTGVGLAAEIASAYPAKTVTLVHSGPRLLSTDHTSNSMSRKAHKKLRSLGVLIHLNERVMIPPGEPLTSTLECRWLKTSKGRTVFSNLQFLCNGITFSTTFMDSLNPAAKDDIIDGRTGQIRVLPTMQINHPDLPWIFAAGDVCDTAGEKQAYRADSQGGHVAQCMMRMAQAWFQGNSRWFETPLKKWQDPAQYMSVPLGPDAGVTDTPWIVLGDLPTRIMKSRELFLARRYKEFNLEFPGIPKAARSSISSGSAGAVAPHADVGGVNANVRVATDIGGPSYELTKAFADVAFAEARHLDDQLDSDRVSLSHPSLRRTISVSAKSHTPTQLQSQISRPAASPSPAPSPSPSAAPEAESAVQGTGYPYYDFRRRGRVPTVRGSDSSDAYSSDEEHEIVRSPCSPTNVYIHGAACTNCGHINYSQTTFTSSVSASVPSSKASVNTTSSRLPVATTPTIRDMSSALRFGPVLPRHTKSPASPPVSPPLSSQKSTKTKSPMEGTHVSSTATIHLEQYRRVSVDSASR